jgi:hypothetical protein
MNEQSISEEYDDQGAFDVVEFIFREQMQFKTYM